MTIPKEYFRLLGIGRDAETKTWRQISGLTTGKGYHAEGFIEKYVNLGKFFDPDFFSERLGQLLFATFTKMLAIIGLSVFILLLFYFVDISLTVDRPFTGWVRAGQHLGEFEAYGAAPGYTIPDAGHHHHRHGRRLFAFFRAFLSALRRCGAPPPRIDPHDGIPGRGFHHHRIRCIERSPALSFEKRGHLVVAGHQLLVDRCLCHFAAAFEYP